MKLNPPLKVRVIAPFLFVRLDGTAEQLSANTYVEIRSTEELQRVSSASFEFCKFLDLSSVDILGILSKKEEGEKLIQSPGFDSMKPIEYKSIPRGDAELQVTPLMGDISVKPIAEVPQPTSFEVVQVAPSEVPQALRVTEEVKEETQPLVTEPQPSVVEVTPEPTVLLDDLLEEEELVEEAEVLPLPADRKKELQGMKSADLKNLCQEYGLTYTNKSQAIQDILLYEFE